ncbi:MAG: SUMF1/EgtB/PvdO family nonheme iron enzyme [Saprospiraceae bacterium]
MINKTVVNYTIKYLIGSGGMANVYYAENKLGKKAAIKVLKAELCAIGAIKERFEQEAKIMVDIEHKHIRQAYDLDEVNGQPAIIMEYLEGDTLKELIDRGKISDEKAQKYFDQCVLALRITHSKDIVHRDIKPSNIFITRADEVKILDFGIAKVKESGLGTRTNQMLGTPVYLSPEQIKSPKNVDTKSDVYSLAVTFYHALTGKVPYDCTTDSDFEIQSKIVHEDLDLSRVSSIWSGILRPMLSKPLSDRVSIYEVNDIGRNQTEGDSTQYDPVPPKPKPEPNPKPTSAITSVSIPKWLHYLIGGSALAISVMLGVRSCGSRAISTDLVVYEDGSIYGYKDAKGRVVIHARYETASPFIEGRGKVSVADSVYYIDERGSIVEVLKPEEEPMVEKQPMVEEEPMPSEMKANEESAWQQANSSATKSSYEVYIFDYPGGNYVSDARNKIREIETAEQKKQEQANNTKPYIKMVNIPGRGFKLSDTEVTIGQYLAFCKVTNSHWPEWLEKGSQHNIYTGSDDYYKKLEMSESNTNHPIIGVSALDADAFCNWMGGRLPTETEWEYAAKGGENYKYAGSNNVVEVGWYNGNSAGKVKPVKQLKANGYGLYDMSGNVWEWTSSKEGAYRVYRGGSWSSNALLCLVSLRIYLTPDNRFDNIGFRLAAY